METLSILSELQNYYNHNYFTRSRYSFNKKSIIQQNSTYILFFLPRLPLHLDAVPSAETRREPHILQQSLRKCSRPLIQVYLLILPKYVLKGAPLC